ncbi:Bcr/CflA family efflux MFS transporter [Mesoterricola silvestris]|uniref:Bcr/CflA family drug resistance efflux transporter n=1 Tax=Mesoterricola silvestris TaxID=2927979 RepID=A0AA48KDP9_9BACT|nr:Bcr/CflA family efflux MFS transporter [Mesoterricola silvestris]BDU74663.1 Bcr/CflA family drug resistance efflux transporter [Mesoterricola silvestris]
MKGLVRSKGFSLFIAAMAAMPPLSIDLILPALVLMAGALGASPARVGLAISLFLLGFASSQLVLGPLSDRVGRRPVLLGSCLLFAAAGLGCALAGSLPVLLALRLAQGVAAGGCNVVIFAVVRDLFEGDEVRRKLATANALLGLAPMAAPALGALLLGAFGWRGMFAALGGGGLLLLAACALLLEESIGGRRRRVGAGQLARGYLEVLAARPVLGCTLVAGLSFGMLQAHVIGSSVLFMSFLHLSPRAYALVFSVIASGQILGALASGQFARLGYDHVRTLLAGILLGLTGSLVFLALGMAGRLSVATAAPALFLVTTALGLITPTAAHGVLAPMARMAGTASAVLGCIRMSGGALASALVSLTTHGTPAGMAGVMLVCSGGALAVWMLFLKPSGAREADPGVSLEA